MFSHYGYMHTMYELAGEKYEDMEYWREQSFIYILNCRCHWKDVQEEKIAQMQAVRPK